MKTNQSGKKIITSSSKVTSKVGKIVPVNLTSSSPDFGCIAVLNECCGPYAQCKIYSAGFNAK